MCKKLEKERKNGRNDYPVRTMLNLIYAMKIFGHRSVESFRRELSRNSQLRIVCGLSEGKFKYCGERKHLVPPARVFTGFLNKLKNCEQEIEDKPIAYNEDGEVFYIVDLNNYEKMKYLGYDKENNCLRYTRERTGKKIYRIPLSTDYRIFTPVARDSKKFKTKYKMRTEVERLNGRIERDYMFNDYFIRGQKKMELMLNLTFVVMLTLAKGHIKNKQENIRSLVA